jgi:hypothetical protein
LGQPLKRLSSLSRSYVLRCGMGMDLFFSKVAESAPKCSY